MAPCARETLVGVAMYARKIVPFVRGGISGGRASCSMSQLVLRHAG